MDKETGQEMEGEQMPFLEWLAEKYKDFGATLEFVSDRSSEGNQFVKGFGGIGAMLRYKVNFEQLAEVDDEDEYYDGKIMLPFDILINTNNASRLTIRLPRKPPRGCSRRRSEGAPPYLAGSRIRRQE